MGNLQLQCLADNQKLANGNIAYVYHFLKLECD